MNPFAKARIKAGLRQEEVASALHVDRSTIAKWETGVAKPRADKLMDISKLYGCTPGQLLTGEEDDAETEKAV